MAVTAEALVKKAKECGYDKCGIIPVEQMDWIRGQFR